MARSPRKPVPKLSIGLPVYNAEQLLPQALDHILAQTFKDFELVICDNASTDRTSRICRDYAGRDARIRYVRNDRNLGANPNYNRTYELSAAPLFKWAAHDDLYQRTYLENCVRILDDDPTVVLAHSGTTFIGDDGQAFIYHCAEGQRDSVVTKEYDALATARGLIENLIAIHCCALDGPDLFVLP